MIIKSTLLLTALCVSPITITSDPLLIPPMFPFPYESLYTIETTKNKNIMEYNTMTMEELIRLNNEKLSIRPE